MTTLIVDGNIVSTGNTSTEVPRLRFSVRNAGGQEIYTWTALPARSVLEPGEKLEFHSRLASPPAAAADVLVRFFNAQDAAAGNDKIEKIVMARILIAEDDEAVRRLVARALGEDGHELTATSDGAEALEALHRHDGDFDLLLADVKMPVMDGIALALAAGRDRPDMPIMLMTGYADQRERAHGLDALVHDVIAKPFSLDQIKDAVREALIAR